MECRLEWCENKAKTRGMCGMHYQRWQKGHDLTTPARSNARTPETCTVEGCENTYQAKGYCATHYSRYRTGLDIYAPVRLRGIHTGCTVPGCDSPHDSLGHCAIHAHYRRNYSLSNDQILQIPDKCEACGAAGPVVVDHDHDCCPGDRSCGKCVRGYICRKCNSGIGLLGDTAEGVEKALKYLQKALAKSLRLN